MSCELLIFVNSIILIEILIFFDSDCDMIETDKCCFRTTTKLVRHEN